MVLLVLWGLFLALVAYSFVFWRSGWPGVLIMTAVLAVTLPTNAWWIRRRVRQIRSSPDG
ncbi:MAG: hypothetical protein U0446_03195 [Dehalococcoidia bacterium]